MTIEATVFTPAAAVRATPRRPRVKPRMMLIVNPKATTVSARLKNLVVYALRGRYDLEPIETERPSHAIELTREAAESGYDLVVAFGGDGTVNEAANGLAGSPVPLTVLPGGCTNVVCRMLEIPVDIVDATEHLLGLADELRSRTIDLGVVEGRRFVSSAGAGLDAETTRWVDERTSLKHRVGPAFFGYAGALSFGRYRRRPARMTAEVDGARFECVTAVAQNSDPYTFFNSRPIRLCDGERLDSGVLSLAALRSARGRDAGALAWRLLSGRSLHGHPQIESFTGIERLRLEAISGEDGAPAPFPVQVDGDTIGEYAEARISIEPAALRVVC